MATNEMKLNVDVDLNLVRMERTIKVGDGLVEKIKTVAHKSIIKEMHAANLSMSDTDWKE